MNPLAIAAIVYGIIAVLYAFRMVLKYFTYLEGEVRNGTIITTAIAAGFIWPVTLVLDGIRGVWAEIAPVKVVALEPLPQPPPTQFDPNTPLDPSDLTRAAAVENLRPQNENWR